MNEAVKQTLLARVYDVAIETPLEYAKKLSERLGANVYLKREDLQPVHSFKLRGAYNKMVQLTDNEREKGVLAASAGNHAQGVALSAQKLGIQATVVMPTTTPEIKVTAVKSYGANVVLHGNNYSEAADYAKELGKTSGKTFIHPFDDPLVIAGQGTIGREILEQLPKTTHIFVPVGGGGLIAGIAQYVKQLQPQIKIIGVEPEDSNALQLSLKKQRRVELSHVGIFADGVAVKQVGENTFNIARDYVDEVVTVNTDQICSAIKTVFEDTRSILEPAGSLAIAAIENYTSVHNDATMHLVAICSGANMTFERLQFISERTLLGSKREAIFSVSLPEKPGALREFCKKVVQGHNITEFSYRHDERQQANIFVGVSVGSEADKEEFSQRMTKHKYDHIDLSSDDLAKEHIRHMIGSASKSTKNEYVYEVQFPEKPGALAEFLETMGDQWSISLFHCRGIGFDTAKVLIGYHASNQSDLEKQLQKTGYWFVKANSKALPLFIT